MEIYRLDLDALEEARDKHQSSTIKVSENIDTSYKVITGVRDWYLGEDGITFDTGFTNFTETYTKQLKETLSKAGEALADGLDDAKACKKICNDFIISLGGEGNGKSEADMHGEFYCDQSVISELKAACTDAVSPTIPIRKTAQEVKDILDELEMVKLDASPYTGRIGKGCDEVERLEDHSLELGTYARTAETNDDSFKCALESCLPSDLNEWFWQDYTGGIDTQAETVMKIMNQKNLSEEDKETLAENLKIMEEYKDIEGLRKAAEHAGNGEDGEWTAGDIYVMAYIYKYAENNADAELATAVYNKMKKTEYITWDKLGDGESVEFVKVYEVGLDEEKVSDILGELNPETDGLAYYSLQRRSKYTQRVEVPISESSEEVAKESFEINFEAKDNKLVSVFTTNGETMRLASVDMNEVIGEDGKRGFDKLKYSKEERIALMSSIYTDEDIPFIRDLVRAETEEDYREVFQHDPNLLSVNTKAGLYNYSVALVDKNVKYDENMMITKQDFTQLESFINGMLYKESDRIKFENYEIGGTNDWAGDYRKEYLESMIMCGETQMDILRYQMEANYNNTDYVKNSLGWFAENTQILSLYATIDTRMSKCPVYLFQDNYMKIDGLGLDFVSGEEGASENINEIMFSYCENLMYDDEAVAKEENGEAYATNIKISKLTGKDVAVEEFSKECEKKVKQARYALPNGIIKACTAMVPDYIPYVGEIVDEALGYADLVDNGVSVYEAYREAEEANKKMNQMLSGAQIVYTAKVGNSKVDSDIVLGGKYDANALLKMEQLENEGLVSFHIEKDIAINNEIINNIDGNDLKNDIDSEKFYLLWYGETYVEENNEQCSLRLIKDIKINEVREKISDLEEANLNEKQRIDYLDYNIIENKYLKEETGE